MPIAENRRRSAFWATTLELAAIVLCMGAIGRAAQAAAPVSPRGVWLTEDGGGVIEVKPCGEAFCGIIVGLSDWPANGDVKRDVTGRPQCHMILLDTLRPHDDGRWHGTVRNPEDGRVYQAEVWIPPDGSLRLRGYIGLPLFGSTQIWPPYRGPVRADCRFH